MPTKVVKVKEKEIEGGPRRAIEYFASSKRSSPLIHVFDEFWREGELALIFGASGTGKSLLAFQVADALARGMPIHGFVMPTGRQKVLYVDFNLSDVQFRNRYRGFKASKNLYRERFIGEGDHFERIKKSVEANGIRVVIIDDLSAVKRTNDGVRETLAFMRQLKQLCEELGISILAVSDAAEPKNGEVSENDLGRSRILCTLADSVFAIGRTRHSEDGRYI
ncbi:MAG: AAA family ATPase, partial [Pyrinomonadaceae bacterium]